MHSKSPIVYEKVCCLLFLMLVVTSGRRSHDNLIVIVKLEKSVNGRGTFAIMRYAILFYLSAQHTTFRSKH